NHYNLRIAINSSNGTYYFLKKKNKPEMILVCCYHYLILTSSLFKYDKNSFAFFSGGRVTRLTPTNNPIERSNAQTPEPYPNGLSCMDSRITTTNPLMITLVITPAAVPLFQKNAPIMAGTATIKPAEEATESTAIKSNCNSANP